jgi:hypothetical protein
VGRGRDGLKTGAEADIFVAFGGGAVVSEALLLGGVVARADMMYWKARRVRIYEDEMMVQHKCTKEVLKFQNSDRPAATCWWRIFRGQGNTPYIRYPPTPHAQPHSQSHAAEIGYITTNA